jgi:hypothetical protein
VGPVAGSPCTTWSFRAQWTWAEPPVPFSPASGIGDAAREAQLRSLRVLRPGTPDDGNFYPLVSAASRRIDILRFSHLLFAATSY